MQLSPVTAKTMENLASSWVRFIKFREVGFFIWPPKSNAARRIVQFLHDDSLQKTFDIDSYKTLFIYLDFQEEPNVKVPQLKEMVLHELGRSLSGNVSLNGSFDMLETLIRLQKKGHEIVFFITGVDEMLRKENMFILKELISIYERLQNIPVLFFTSTYITPVMKKKLFEKHALVSNFFYKPIYSTEDSEQFFNFTKSRWHIRVHDNQKSWILENCSGRLGLIKNALRLVRDNPSLTPEELAAHPSMIDRVRAIFDAIPSEVTAVLSEIIKKSYRYKSQDKDVIDYLINVGMIEEHNKTYTIFPPYLQNAPLPNYQTPIRFTDLEVMLTGQERRVFKHLSQSTNTIFSRMSFAELMWESDVDEQYSDWAIDQLVHRIREKLEKTKAPYELITKKGHGFILVSK